MLMFNSFRNNRGQSTDVLVVALGLFMLLGAGRGVANSSQIELFVDAATGSDTNSGTAGRPLKTLKQALSLAMRSRALGTSTIITVSPGVYREAINLQGKNSQTAPIAIQSDNTGEVIISGSDRWSQWQALPNNPSIVFQSWPYRWGTCVVPAGWPTITPLGLRRELVFVEDIPMVQVLDQQAMHEGTFFVDENVGQILLWPPNGVNISTADVEVGIRPTLLQTQNVSNLSVHGLTFEHATSCISTNPSGAVMISGADSISIADSVFRWNNWMGLQLFSLTNIQVQNSAAVNNGELGISGYRLKDGLISNVELSYNDWRSAMGNLWTWEPSGAKFVGAHTVSLQFVQVVANQGRGLWFDTDNSGVVISNSVMAANVSGGLDIEASMGPVTLQDSTLCGDLTDGIQGNNAEHVTLRNNQIFGNQKSQLEVLVTPVPRIAVNWETGITFAALSEFWNISRNTIVGTDTNQLLYQDTLLAGDPGAGPFLTTLVSDYNNWYQPNVALPFHFFLPESSETNSPADPSEQTATLSGWRTVTKTDQHSTAAAPAVGLTCPSGTMKNRSGLATSGKGPGFR